MEKRLNITNLINNYNDKNKLLDIKKKIKINPFSLSQISIDGSLTNRDYLKNKFKKIKKKNSSVIHNLSNSNSKTVRHPFFNKNLSDSHSHSILGKLNENIVNSFNNSIRKTKENYIMTLYKSKPNLLPPKIKKRLDKKISSNPLLLNSYENFIELNSLNNSKIFSKKNLLNQTFSKSDANLHSRYRSFKSFTKEKRILNPKINSFNNVLNPLNKINPVIQKDIQFQSSIIKDEISILIDDIKIFQKNCLYNPLLISSFKNKDLIYQTKSNKLFEECNCLLILIPKLLLGSYFKLVKENISIPTPTKQDFSPSYVKNEIECYVKNCNLLNKILICLEKYYDLYSDLIQDFKDNTMLIKSKPFNKLLAVLKKTRYLIGELNISGINSIKDLEFDKKLIKKYIPFEKANTDRIKKDNIHQYDIFKRIANNMSFKLNEEKQKTKRVNQILNDNHERNEEKEIKERNHLILMKQKKLSKFIIVRI